MKQPIRTQIVIIHTSDKTREHCSFKEVKRVSEHERNRTAAASGLTHALTETDFIKKKKENMLEDVETLAM